MSKPTKTVDAGSFGTMDDAYEAADVIQTLSRFVDNFRDEIAAREAWLAAADRLNEAAVETGDTLEGIEEYLAEQTHEGLRAFAREVLDNIDARNIEEFAAHVKAAFAAVSYRVEVLEHAEAMNGGTL